MLCTVFVQFDKIHENGGIAQCIKTWDLWIAITMYYANCVYCNSSTF